MEHADVRERPTDDEVLDAVGVEPPRKLGLVEGVVGVFLHHEVVVPGVEFRDQFGLPGAFEDVFAPAVELVVVVGVLELLGRVDVAGEDDARAGAAGAVDEPRDGLDGRLAVRCVEAPVGVTEAVLHVDDHEGRLLWVQLHGPAFVRDPYERSGVRLFTVPPQRLVMRREFAVVCCAVILLLAGCQGLDAGTSAETPTDTEYVNTTTVVLDGGNLTDGGTTRPDPERDRLGWENGYWHNDSLNVSNGDGLNESELSAVVNRSMARVEYVRGLEFEGAVPVRTVSRASYRNRSANASHGDALRTFDNAKFEALFLVGEDTDSIETQESALGASVLGYYSPSLDEIVIVTDSETPRISEKTLSHELVHALQDQRFDLASNASTRDGLQGRNALIEGDAKATETAYMDRCGTNWSCVTVGQSGGAAGDTHFGVSYMLYFPYSDGSSFVATLRERGGWDAVNDAYGDVPDGAREVITPSDYPEWEPRNVTIPQPPSGDWERVRPSTDRDRPDYATVGPSAIAASLAYTTGDGYNDSSVVSQSQLADYRTVRSDPYNYDLPGTSGWDGGRMQVYTKDGETGYVWRTTWSDDASAERFAAAWARVIQHWGGERTADGNWVIDGGSPFADAVAVRVDGDTVTVVNAPTEAELSELYDA